MAQQEEKIKLTAKALGYDACGIIEALDFDEFLNQLDTRSELFPHSGPLYDKLRRIARPKDTVDWAQSIIVCLRRYDKYKLPDGLEQLVGKVYLTDGRLSYSKEYAAKLAFEQFLQDLGFRTAQNIVPARWSAVRAGLGKFRNNNFLYTEHGSWNWIDTWVVDKKLDYEPPYGDARLACPEGCHKCVECCPTAALSSPFTMDATNCVAYLSFTPGVLPPKNLLDKMGTWLYGCDICQNVCPANGKTWPEHGAAFPDPWPLPDLINLETLFSIDEATYQEKIQPRFSYIGKDNLWLWKCNAIRAMANNSIPKYHSYFLQALTDPDENVRKVASWALAKPPLPLGQTNLDR
jgi:epoxyqueuosine reductase